MLGEEWIDPSSKERLNRFVMPYDCLMGSISRNPFLRFVDKVLEMPLDNQNIGCLVNMPTRIGSKLYIDHFYEADFLFQNSFFTDRFAFFAARGIESKVKSSGNIPIEISNTIGGLDIELFCQLQYYMWIHNYN